MKGFFDLLVFFCWETAFWNARPQHIHCHDWFVFLFSSTYPAGINFLFDIQNIKKLTKWLSWNWIFIRLRLISWRWNLSVNYPGVETMAAIRILLYCCWSSHSLAYLYNFLVFSRHQCLYKLLLLNDWYTPIIDIYIFGSDCSKHFIRTHWYSNESI